MRLFLAIELPDEVRRWLVDHRDRKEWFGFEGFRGTRPENLHATVKFLGEVAEQRVPDVVAALRDVTLPGPLDLSIDGFTFFPPRGPIRVFAARIGGTVDALKQLHARVEDVLELLGFAREGRPYSPHVTLGRPDPGRRILGVARQLVAKHPPSAGPTFVVDGFTLFHSHLRPDGPEYIPLARFG